MEHVDRIVGVIFVVLGVLGLVAGFYAVATRRHTSQIGLFRLVERGGTVTYERVQTLVHRHSSSLC